MNHAPEKLKRFTLDTLKTSPKQKVNNGNMIVYNATRLEKFYPFPNFRLELAVFNKTININYWIGNDYSNAKKIKLNRFEYKDRIGEFLYNIYLIEKDKFKDVG